MLKLKNTKVINTQRIELTYNLYQNLETKFIKHNLRIKVIETTCVYSYYDKLFYKTYVHKLYVIS
jgi:hypothetical protein